MQLKKLWLENIILKYGIGNTHEAYQNDINSFISFLISKGEGEIYEDNDKHQDLKAQAVEEKDEEILGHQYHQNEIDCKDVGYKKTIARHEQEIDKNLEALLLSVNIRHIRSWLAYLKNLNLSSSSIARKLSSIRSFYKFLLRNNYNIDEDIFALKTPKKPKSIPKSMTNEQIDQILSALESRSLEKWIIARDKAIILLAYCEGLRISEILLLTKEHVAQDYLRIKGKGMKERILPWLNSAKEATIEYLSLNPFDIKDNEPIFRGIRGAKIGRTQFNKILIDLRQSFNLPDHLTPHAFRHSFATALLENGADLRAIGELLGHTSLSTTQIYTKTSVAHLKLAHKKAFD